MGWHVLWSQWRCKSAAFTATGAGSVLGEAVCTDVEVGAGELITISDVRGDVLSISASSLKPEGTSVSSSGLDMSVQSRSLSISGEGKTPEGLIRPGGSPPRPRRTGAAGHSAALAAREARPFGGGRRCSKRTGGAQ